MRVYKLGGRAFTESVMTLKFSMCSDIERFSMGSGVTFFQSLGIITDHAEREQQSGCLFIDAKPGVVVLHMKRG